MKGVKFDFVHRRHRLLIWAAWTAVVVGIGGWTAQRTLATGEARNLAIASANAAMAELRQLASPAQIKTDPRQASIGKSQALLTQDLNKLANPLENLQEYGVRARSLTFDGATGAIRVELELDSANRAMQVNTALNGGYTAAPWRLDGLSRNSSSVAQQRLSGAWHAAILDL